MTSQTTQTRTVPGSRTSTGFTSSPARAAPAASVVPRSPGIPWVLLPIGLLVFAAAGYAVVEPDGALRLNDMLTTFRRHTADVPRGLLHGLVTAMGRSASAVRVRAWAGRAVRR